MSYKFHPIDNLECVELRIMYREISNLPGNEKNSKIVKNYEKIIEEKCNTPEYKQFNKRYHFNPELNQFTILPTESDNCKIWKSAFNTHNVLFERYYVRKIFEDC